MGEHQTAAKWLARLGEFPLAAQEFEKAAQAITTLNPRQSAQLLQQAAGAWRDAKQHHECMGVVLRNPWAAKHFEQKVCFSRCCCGSILSFCTASHETPDYSGEGLLLSGMTLRHKCQCGSLCRLMATKQPGQKVSISLHSCTTWAVPNKLSLQWPSGVHT